MVAHELVAAHIGSCIAYDHFAFYTGKVSANYVVTNDEVQWLQVIYNGAVVLRYKLNIRKEPFNYPPIIIKDIAINN